MKRIALGAALLLLPMCGCVPLLSLHPLWDEAIRVDAPELCGTWVVPDGDETLEIRDSGDSRYQAVYTAVEHTKAVSSRYLLHAAKLGSHLFLDLEPDESTFEECAKAEAFLPVVHAHFFARAVVQGDRLVLGVLDDEAFVKKVRADRIDINYEARKQDGEEVVLTAATDRIQRFVLAYAEDPDLWNKTEFRRKPGSRPDAAAVSANPR